MGLRREGRVNTSWGFCIYTVSHTTFGRDIRLRCIIFLVASVYTIYWRWDINSHRGLVRRTGLYIGLLDSLRKVKGCMIPHRCNDKIWIYFMILDQL